MESIEGERFWEMTICYAYFNYKENCVKEEGQWYNKGLHCCMEMPKEKWGTKEDKKFMDKIRKDAEDNF